MSILSWEKLKRVEDTTVHAEKYQSDSGIRGTYVQNMSEVDQLRWKAKHIGGEDPRVEIRKTLTLHGYCQLLLVVRNDPERRVVWSMNGKGNFDSLDWVQLQQVISETVHVLIAADNKLNS